MKMQKVIVDELPKSCAHCRFRTNLDCWLLCAPVYIADTRHKDCPLQTERNCGNCKHVDDNTRLILCSADVGLCADSGGIELSDYCSRWEANHGK